jgi:hypothetical protein
MFYISQFIFTIVEAMFALDGNSYITTWLIVMYLKNTGEIRRFERSSFVGKLVLRGEVCLLTPRRRAFARNVEFPLYFPRTSIPINQVLLLLPVIIGTTTRGYYRKESAALDLQANTETSNISEN